MGISDNCLICDSTKPATVDVHQSQMGDFVILDVSGVCYKIMKEKIFQFPSSLLFRLLHYSQGSFWPDTDNFFPEGILYLSPNKYFVQRSPDLFDIVLQCYSTGKFHAKKAYCKKAVAEELAFWGLNFVQTCDMCFEDNMLVKSEHSEMKFHENFLRTVIAGGSANEAQKVSKISIIFDMLSMIFVIVSTVNLIISTVPELRFCPKENSFVINGTNSTNYEIETKNIEDDLPFVTNCLGLKVFGYIEFACIVWFTFEILIRFSMRKSVKKFFTSPMHVIDILAIIPYYIELILYAVDSSRNGIRRARTVLLLLRVLRMIRIFRILKIARYSEDLKILGVTFAAAKKELFMLFLFLFIGLIIFSSVVYQLEKDEVNSDFTSIPASCWWGIVTLTTVGYGDVTTKTHGGKFIASLACVFGVLVMAFPISILVEHFMAAYKQRGKTVDPINNTKTNDLSLKKSTKIPIYCNKVAPLQIEHTKI